MKRRFWIFLALAALIDCGTALAEQDVAIDPVHFPDENFRTVAARFDLNHDKVLSAGELAQVKTIECYSEEISDLKGIEFFTQLTMLDCSGNSLTRLDMSGNPALVHLYCYGNSLGSLDVSQNTGLKLLECNDNELSTLDVSRNKALSVLRCRGNYLSTLDVTRNPALGELNCSGNMLEELDIRSNTTLAYLHCSGNMLGSIDLRNNAALTDLDCSDNELESIDIRKNTALETLDCSDNRLTQLDLRKNTKIDDLACQWNQLTELDITLQPGLVAAVEKGTKTELGGGTYRYSDDSACLWIDQNVALITGIPINAASFPDALFRAYVESHIDANGDRMLSSNEIGAVTTIGLYDSENYTYEEIGSLKGIELFYALEELDCSHCQLTALDLGANTALKKLDCSYNELTRLSLGSNTTLEWLDCSVNDLTALSIGANTALEWLVCDHNRLTSLDVSQIAIQDLVCTDNRLTSLIIGENADLEFLSCRSNRLKTVDISGAPMLLYIRYNGTLTSYEGYRYYSADAVGSLYVDNDTDLITRPIPDDCIRIPDSVTRIEAEAFLGTSATSFLVPRSVTFIGKNAFPSGARIYGTEGYAENWAKENGCHFIPALG